LPRFSFYYGLCLRFFFSNRARLLASSALAD
jgi:hypothetical protein